MKKTLFSLIIFTTCFQLANAKINFLSDGKNAFGIGVFNHNTLYWNRDGNTNSHVADFSGWSTKYVRNINNYNQFSMQYYNAKGGQYYLSGYNISEHIGLNLNNNGMGIYTGFSFAHKKSTELSTIRGTNSFSRDSLEIPLGFQVQNDHYILSIEAVVNGNDLSRDKYGIDYITPPISIHYSMKF